MSKQHLWKQAIVFLCILSLSLSKARPLLAAETSAETSTDSSVNTAAGSQDPSVNITAAGFLASSADITAAGSLASSADIDVAGSQNLSSDTAADGSSDLSSAGTAEGEPAAGESAGEELAGESVGEESAGEESTGEEPTGEPERLEPDAFFEPIQTDAITGWPAGPAVWAESAVVMDLDSKAFLYSKNMDAVKYPASITKIMTTLLAIENARADERVLFSENAIFGIERDSSHIGIRVGEILSMEDCWYGMMLESANEVCLAVAEHICGSVEAFVDLMNQKAAELGCTNTHFTNPNGLPDENHYTTAHDMALIAQAAYAKPTFRKICRTQIYCIPKTNVCGEERWLNNHHKMLPDQGYDYEGCTGGKTGYTMAALNTLVTFAERDGRRLVCVSMRTNGRQVYTDTAAMLDYGFSQFQTVALYERTANAAAHMLYPSIYFGKPMTVDALRLSCFVTIPADASLDQIQTVSSVTEDSIVRSYQFQQYQVGCESLPTGAILSIMTAAKDAVPDENSSGSDDGSDDSPLSFSVGQEPLPGSAGGSEEKDSLWNKALLRINNILVLTGELPVWIYVIFLILVCMIMLEAFLMIKRGKRKRQRRREQRARRKKEKNREKTKD